MKALLLFTAVAAFIIVLVVTGLFLLLGQAVTLAGMIELFGVLCLGIGIPLLILSAIVCAINDGVSRLFDKNHAAYVKDLQERGFTPQQIQDKVDDPGLFARHSGKLGIVALIILACFVPITLPVLAIYALHMLWGWRHLKDDVREYEATRGGPPVLEDWEKDAHERSGVRPQGPDLFTNFGR